jgi:hypothetical protein
VESGVRTIDGKQVTGNFRKQGDGEAAVPALNRRVFIGNNGGTKMKVDTAVGKYTVEQNDAFASVFFDGWERPSLTMDLIASSPWWDNQGSGTSVSWGGDSQYYTLSPWYAWTPYLDLGVFRRTIVRFGQNDDVTHYDAFPSGISTTNSSATVVKNGETGNAEYEIEWHKPWKPVVKGGDLSVSPTNKASWWFSFGSAESTPPLNSAEVGMGIRTILYKGTDGVFAVKYTTSPFSLDDGNITFINGVVTVVATGIGAVSLISGNPWLVAVTAGITTGITGGVSSLAPATWTFWTPPLESMLPDGTVTGNQVRVYVKSIDFIRNYRGDAYDTHGYKGQAYGHGRWLAGFEIHKVESVVDNGDGTGPAG